ncbi:MAG: protein kinase [Verrucomicrobia bacterium]|nr:protein kinase [Verrucomicrobiota bacterium]
MDSQTALPYREQVEQFRRRFRTGSVTLVFTDLAGSTQLKQTLGDREGVALIQHHHSVVRERLRQFAEAEAISTAGDSFFLVFARPSDAVKFALLLLGRLRQVTQEGGHALADRVGIHVGEVVIEQEASAASPKDLYGIHVDICARVMGLAGANQILLTRSAFDNARAALRGEDLPGVGELRWANHGPYLLKGIDEPVEICEVRAAEGTLTPPATTEKAHRHVSPEAEPVLGWRPALGQVVPNTKWVLEQKLGEGGFGEVWLGRHQTMKERRVFKFCFRADRVRFLKREMTLFRLMKERVGDHPNIVRLLEVYFDEPPFYVEMDYVEGKDLKSWCDAQGGVDKVPLEVRLEIVAQVADALQAAHDAGVIHREVKPTNVLVHRSSRRESDPTSSGREDEPTHVGCYEVQAKLTDFGIGQVVSAEVLAGVTQAGFTQTMMSDSSTSHTGTQLYMAPELLAGKPASTRSDIYSLGVVLHQLLVGDFTHPVTTDWADGIADPLLRDDLKHCFAGNPQDRFAAAAQLAKNLRALAERQAALARQRAELAAKERAAYRRGMIRTAVIATAIVAAVSILAVYAFRQARISREQSQINRRLLYVSDMNLAQQALKDGSLQRAEQLLDTHIPRAGQEDLRGFEWHSLKRLCQGDQSFTFPPQERPVQCLAFSPDGRLLATGTASERLWKGFGVTVASPSGLGAGELKLFDVASRQELSTLIRQTVSITCLAFSPDGEILAAGNADGTVTSWNVTERTRRATLTGHTNAIRSLAFSPDRQTLATGSEPDKVVKIWNLQSQRELWSRNTELARLHCLVYSPDGGTLAIAGGYDIKLINVSTKLPRVIPWGVGMVWDVAFSPDGKFLAVAQNNTFVRVLDLTSTNLASPPVATLGKHKREVVSVAFLPHGRTLVSGSPDHTLKLLDVDSKKELAVLKGHRGPVWQVAVSPDAKTVASASEDKTVRLWQTDRVTEADVLASLSGWIGALDFSPDGRWMANCGSKGTVELWDFRTQQPVATFRGQSNVSSVKFSVDSRFLFSHDQSRSPGSFRSTIQVWDVDSKRKEPLATLTGHNYGVEALAVSPADGTLVSATGSWRWKPETRGEIKMWDVPGLKERASFLANTNGVASLAISPDGKLLATGGEDHVVKLWDFSTQKLRAEFKEHDGMVVSLVFSPDGRLLASGGPDNRLILWDVLKRKKLRELETMAGGIDSLVFSPDGKTLAASYQSATVKLWNVATFKEVVTLTGYDGFVNQLAFSPDGKMLASRSEGKLRLWPAARFLLNEKPVEAGSGAR